MSFVGFCLAGLFVAFLGLVLFSLLTPGRDLFISFPTLGNGKIFSQLAPGLNKQKQQQGK